ncbi:hypothetical protein [Noviherbaspirillum pedocola]|uniref:Uncharacterized protein n=1 Tax=Noviherbaspirillum pedocola TaxID=2801341 RepID=A0A934SYK5_9BURK|nr:hypothetical protein [Noviherbaspirillum pedocola]MBK4737406.1 hypothetical protein [Noviherbaspirillum pedocola]
MKFTRNWRANDAKEVGFPYEVIGGALRILNAYCLSPLPSSPSSQSSSPRTGPDQTGKEMGRKLVKRNIQLTFTSSFDESAVDSSSSISELMNEPPSSYSNRRQDGAAATRSDTPSLIDWEKVFGSQAMCLHGFQLCESVLDRQSNCRIRNGQTNARKLALPGTHRLLDCQPGTGDIFFRKYRRNIASAFVHPVAWIKLEDKAAIRSLLLGPGKNFAIKTLLLHFRHHARWIGRISSLLLKFAVADAP